MHAEENNYDACKTKPPGNGPVPPEKEDNPLSEVPGKAVWGGLATITVAGLILISRYHYPLFHSLAELISIATAWAVFLLVYNSRRFIFCDALVFLGVAYAMIGIVDLLHALAYPGMGGFPGDRGMNLPAQLWIASRCMAAAAFLLFPLLLDRRLPLAAMTAAVGMTTAVLLAAIFLGVFPACYIQGAGFTSFMSASEYLAALTLVAAALAIRKKRRSMGGQVYRLLTVAILLTVLTELTGAFQAEGYSAVNVAGHLFKIASLLFIYLALLNAGLVHPYNAMARYARESENKFWQLAEDMPIHVGCALPDGTITYANQSLAGFLGIPAEKLTGQNIGGLFSHDGQDRIRLVARGLTPEAPIRHFENRHQGRDGNPYYFRWVVRGFFDAEEQLGHYQAVGQDISDLINTEEALKESDRLFNLITHNMVDIIWLTNMDLEIHWVSPNVETSLGYTPDEFKALPLERLMNEESLIRLMQVYVDLCSPRRQTDGTPDVTADIDVEYRPKNGPRILARVIMRLIRNADGEPAFILGVSHDITARKHAEAERSRLQDQLLQSQKMESIGRLAGGMAHDFNNMLTVILGNTELTIAEMGDNDPNRENLQEVLTAGRRSADLIRHLLAFARKQTVVPIVLNINEVVESTFKMLKRLIGENIDLMWIPQSDLWPVVIDPAQIDQILTNLLVNSRDAIDDIGRVVIETRNVEENDVADEYFVGVIPGEYVMLRVTDDGRGIPADLLNNIYEPFFTTKPAGQGTGLGLSTVYGIITQNRGFIITESEPGQGTSMRIFLPRADREAMDQEAKAMGRPMHGDETVLLVEDEPATLLLSKIMLQRYGYTVLAAVSPKEALDLAAGHESTIDLLITDVIMPDMNGKVLSDKINALWGAPIKTLYISGYTGDVIETRGVLQSGVQLLKKPFSSTELAIRVRDVLDNT